MPLKMTAEMPEMPIEPNAANIPASGSPSALTSGVPYDVTLKQKTDIHILRKLWHCAGVCGIAAIFNLGTNHAAWMVLICSGIAVIPLDLLRQKRPRLNQFLIRMVGPLMRRSELHSICGSSYLLLGCVFLLAMNSHHVGTLTLLFLAFGDPIASYFGVRYGKDRILGNKTLQGTLASFVVCTLIAGIYYYFNNLMTERLLIVVPISGLIGALAELIPIGDLDDNLTFPVVGSCMLWVLFKVYGGFGI